MSEKEYMLSTIDNPFNPFSKFDEWNQFDLEHNYNSLGLLARIAMTSNELTDKENNEEINRAIDEILKYDLLGLRIKVTSDSEIKPISIEKILEFQDEELKNLKLSNEEKEN